MILGVVECAEHAVAVHVGVAPATAHRLVEVRIVPRRGIDVDPAVLARPILPITDSFRLRREGERLFNWLDDRMSDGPSGQVFRELMSTGADDPVDGRCARGGCPLTQRLTEQLLIEPPRSMFGDLAVMTNTLRSSTWGAGSTALSSGRDHRHRYTTRTRRRLRKHDRQRRRHRFVQASRPPCPRHPEFGSPTSVASR